jgi:hypothetical protein
MKDNMNDLQEMWQNDRSRLAEERSHDTSHLLKEAQQRQQKSIYIQYGNILVLLVSLVAVVYFFSFFLGLNTALSHWGLGLMYGGLTLRIAIEVYSSFRFRKIDISDTTLDNTQTNLRYYRFRKRIHGPVTMLIFGIYTIGFYLLTPEFYHYMKLYWLILIDLSYIPAIAIPFWQARKAIRQEMLELDKIHEIRQRLN